MADLVASPRREFRVFLHDSLYNPSPCVVFGDKTKFELVWHTFCIGKEGGFTRRRDR